MAELELAPVVILGIDLGTTFSVAATMGEHGRPTVLPNQLGDATTPSEVYFRSASSVLVGRAARAAAATDPDNAVALIKRRMGTECELRFHGVAHTPESVSALILRALVAGATTPVRAVITVPAYFGIREREATFQAARLAGIDVLELLAEPVAAALHYGTAVAESDGAVLVYDLGGGTFDTTVLRVTGAGVTVVATDGDSELGGADWDERVVDHLAEHWPDDDDESFIRQLRVEAEVAKLALSVATECDVRLGAVTVRLDRDTFEQMTADLVDRTMTIVARTLAAAAAKGVRRIDDVVLVGGSSRMPRIAAAVAEQLGIRPRLVEPDFAAALGAAVRAHQLADDRTREGLRAAGGALARIADAPTASVVSRSFGILLDDSYDPNAERRFVRHIVHRNDPLPTSGSAEFATVMPGQYRIRVQVFEQAGDVESAEMADNRRVLDGELRLPAGLPAGSPVTITLRVSADGLLGVTARERTGGGRLELEAYVEGVVDEQRTRRLAHFLTGLTVGQ
ncbi:MAG TPA: Hsp70 family protein [Pseudonocardiaceae bacterium]|nr:Hsp70 family protein [Pseudonocardiaceae bacterium]